MIFKTYKKIQDQIDSDFDNYLSELLAIGKEDKEPRKYFYWSLDFFKIIAGLSFQFFDLSSEQKDEINKVGTSFFDDLSVYFEVNKNSHRHDLLIKNVTKLFDGTVSNQQKRYEYIKEFSLWKILSDLEDRKLVGSDIVKLQRSNYLISYITYLVKNSNNPTFEPFKYYIRYNLTNKGEYLIKKLDELDREYIYDSKTKKEIRQINQDVNPELRNKIENLYVLKETESKIQFVFSTNGGGEKEELRELLEIMGKEETGKLYRGQANSYWNLDASITREPKYLANEGDMYYDILSLKPDAFQNDQTVYERLITMQHFGMPTRLLDVTRNPLVSIFFACNNLDQKDNDGVIFTFKPENKSEFLHFEDKKLKKLSILFDSEKDENDDLSTDFLSKIWFVKGVAKNQRINSQSGDFIFVGNGENVTQNLHRLPKMFIFIDSKTKKVLIEQLDSLNVHGGAVYPDLTHMSNYIRNKYLNESSSTSPNKISVSSKPEPSITQKTVTKPKKPITKDTSITQFNFAKIKDKNRKTQLNTFSKFYNIDVSGLEKLVNDIVFTGKPPLRDEVIKAMLDKPALKERAKIIDSLIEKIITLSKMTGEEE